MHGTEHGLETTVQKTHEWLHDIMDAIGADDAHLAYGALRAVLHALRDRLTVDEAVQLGGAASDARPRFVLRRVVAERKAGQDAQGGIPRRHPASVSGTGSAASRSAGAGRPEGGLPPHERRRGRGRQSDPASGPQGSVARRRQFAHPFWERSAESHVARKAIEMRRQGFTGAAMLPMSELDYTGVTEKSRAPRSDSSFAASVTAVADEGLNNRSRKCP